MQAPDQPLPQPAKKRQRQPAGKSLWEFLADLSNAVPDEELAKIPHDGSINLDHYLYGAPKVQP
jgi:hypothetical protein